MTNNIRKQKFRNLFLLTEYRTLHINYNKQLSTLDDKPLGIRFALIWLMDIKTRKETLTILVVDDVPVNQKLIERLIGNHLDARMIFASNGSEAVKIFMEEQVSLILMDMEMPIMDGYTAARTIRNLPNGKDVPIVALTAHSGEMERNRCLEAGCTAYIQKPLQKANLIGTTEEYLKKED